MSGTREVSALAARLKELAASDSASDAELMEAFRNDVPRVLDFIEKSVEVAERAHELLANAFSSPDDAQGIRIQSEDAVKLQWALRGVGYGDDAGESTFTV